MKYQTQIKVISKDKKINLTNYATTFNLNEDTKCGEFKTQIRSTLNFMNELKVVEEVLYLGNKKLEDDQILPTQSGLEYNLIFEK